jgi:hypothetical protein
MSAETPAASAPPVTVDPQDPLPESNWFWRRVFIFLLTWTLLAGVYWYVDTLADAALLLNETAISGLISLLKLALWIVAGLITLYLIAPSAEQAGKWIATLSAWRSGVTTTSTSTATSPTGSATATTSAIPATPAASPVIRTTEVDAAPK